MDDEYEDHGNSWASSAAARKVMQGNRSRDTAPELALRKILHSHGFRYRVDQRPCGDINRRADIVFSRAKVAVFVDGCFWHGCPRHFAPPSTNAMYWKQKIEGNLTRDKETSRLLRKRGWIVIRVWEHQTPQAAALRIARALSLR